MAHVLKYLFLLFPVILQAQNKTIIENLLKKEMESSREIEILASTFIGKPYLAQTLEGPVEKLVCRLDGFDCYTLVETVTALKICRADGLSSYEDFLETMKILRYRGGEINGYASRIHYFFEWAKNAEELGMVEDIGKLKGEVKNKAINFMSQNRQYYPAFKTNDTEWRKIIDMEKKVAQYPFYYLPKSKFKSIENQIQSGDIIAFTSSLNGLDVNHEGFAIWKNGKLVLLHASLEQKKVILSTETLESYLNRISKHDGIMWLRITE